MVEIVFVWIFQVIEVVMYHRASKEVAESGTLDYGSRPYHEISGNTNCKGRTKCWNN